MEWGTYERKIFPCALGGSEYCRFESTNLIEIRAISQLLAVRLTRVYTPNFITLRYRKTKYSSCNTMHSGLHQTRLFRLSEMYLSKIHLSHIFSITLTSCRYDNTLKILLYEQLIDKIHCTFLINMLHLANCNSRQIQSIQRLVKGINFQSSWIIFVPQPKCIDQNIRCDKSGECYNQP